MSIATKFRRLVNLYQLFWAGDRLDGLQTQLQTAVEGLQSQVDQVRGECARVGETMYQMASQTGAQLSILGGQTSATASDCLNVSIRFFNRFALAVSVGCTISTLIISAFVFRRFEKEFADFV